jgi:predicted nucleotidyltransferase
METATTLKPIEIDEATWVARLKDELTRFVEMVVSDFNPHKIILFGSMAEGKPHLWSDIDIVVVRETDKNFIDRGLEIRHRFHPKIGLDLLVYTPEEFADMTKERLFFQEEIIKKGKVLYDRGK